jgi:hypothetical protein
VRRVIAHSPKNILIKESERKKIMLKNAKEMRKNYLKTVKQTAEDFIETILAIEKENLWELELEDGGCELLYLTYGTDEVPCDMKDVYDYMDHNGDERISTDKTVLNALEEIFTISWDASGFFIDLLGYKGEEITE